MTGKEKYGLFYEEEGEKKKLKKLGLALVHHFIFVWTGITYGLGHAASSQCIEHFPGWADCICHIWRPCLSKVLWP